MFDVPKYSTIQCMMLKPDPHLSSLRRTTFGDLKKLLRDEHGVFPGRWPSDWKLAVHPPPKTSIVKGL